MTDQVQVGETVDVTEVIRDLYRTLDEVAAKRADIGKVTCRKGCTFCCYQLTTITIPEGLLIARVLMEKPDWKSLLPKLRQASKDHDYPGVGKNTHFRKQIPCVFLGEDRSCTVYDSRPSVCRFHQAITPPENCDVRNPHAEVAAVNNMDLEAEVWKTALWYQDAIGMPPGPPLVAPIATVVCFCIRELAHETPDESEVQAALGDLLGPDEWLQRHLQSLLAEHS